MIDALPRWPNSHSTARPTARPRRRPVPLLATLAALGALLTLLAGCGETAGGWRMIGPDSGAHVYTVVADPHAAGLVYAGGDDGVVYRVLADQSAGHVVGGAGIPSGAAVATVLPDPLHAGVVFAGTAKGLYRTVHYGDQWSAFGTGLPTDKSALALAATPDDTALLAGVESDGVYRSADDGATWTHASAGLPARATPDALAYDAAQRLWVLGLSTAGASALYTSADNGQTWTPRATGLAAGTQVNALATLDGGRLFAATTDGLYASVDAGHNWSRVAGGLPQGTALALATLSQQSTWLYVSVSSGVYRSTDDGARWQSVAPGLAGHAQGIAVTEGKTSGPVVYVAIGQLARYPIGAAASNNVPGDLALAVAILTLIGSFWVFWRRVVRTGHRLDGDRNETNTGRAAQAAERWGRPQQPTSETDAVIRGPRPGQPNRADDAAAGSPSRATAVSDLTSRATTGIPASEDKTAQNGHGQPKQRQ